MLLDFCTFGSSSSHHIDESLLDTIRHVYDGQQRVESSYGRAYTAVYVTV